MKCRHVFVETMVAPIMETLQKGPIDLIIGQDHTPIRAVITYYGNVTKRTYRSHYRFPDYAFILYLYTLYFILLYIV